MNVLYIILLLFAFKIVDISTQMAFAYAKSFLFHASKDRTNPTFKRFTTDVSFELHKEVQDMALLKNTTLREYVLEAIITRLRYDRTRQKTLSEGRK